MIFVLMTKGKVRIVATVTIDTAAVYSDRMTGGRAFQAAVVGCIIVTAGTGPFMDAADDIGAAVTRGTVA